MKKCLESEALTLRRQSIKDLNSVVNNAPSSPEAKKALINWMSENDVFDILWDPRKTHVELVKQSKGVFDVLCR